MHYEGGIEQLQVKRIRVNGSFMQQHHGKQVCLLGTVVKSDGGQAFSVKASDGAIINVRMKQPLLEPISGLVEVSGTGQGKNLVLGDSYFLFPPETSNNFDTEAYNELIKWINTHDGSENPWKPL